MLTFEITHPDNTKEEMIGSASEEMYEFEKIDIASCYVDRPQANDVTLNEGQDVVTIYEDDERLFEGVLRDTIRGGGEVELVVDSYERWAMDAEPSGGGLVYEAESDETIVRDAIDEVSGLSIGTVEELNPQSTFVFSFASPAKRLRTLAETTGGEVFYYPDRTVDYVEKLGTDKTEASTGIVLSPEAQNISGAFAPERESKGKKVTHLRMLGAGTGNGQTDAVVVPENDPYDYEGDGSYGQVRRYTHPTWTSTARRIWDTRINKDITDSDVLAEHGEILVGEYNTDSVEIETTVEENDVALGDTFTLRHPEEQIDLNLRAVKVSRIIDSDGRSYEVTFSNRRLTRQTKEEKQQKDVERYNLAFEGSNVTMNAGGGRQPVDENHNYEFSIYYPQDIEYEHRVNLQVKGLAYRAYSEGAESGGKRHSHRVYIPGHSHDVSIPSHRHRVTIPDHEHKVSISDHKHSVTVPVPFHTHALSFLRSYTTSPGPNGHDHDYYRPRRTLSPQDNSTEVVSAGSGGGETVTSNSGGGDSVTSSSGGSTTVTSTAETGTTRTSRSATPYHTHDPKPGIIESFNGSLHYPGGCDVIVNGQEVGVRMGDGSGPFEREVDIAGMLTQGSWNTIQVTSDGLGHIQANLFIDVFRQILGGGE